MKLKAEQYNCGGYALGTKDWFRPYKTTHRGARADYQKLLQDNNYDYDEILEKCSTFIIKNSSGNIRRVEEDEEIRKDENLVAFRIGMHDFHFMVRKGKNWFHKMGVENIQRIKKKYVFAESWNYAYDSDIIFFAIKKGV